MSVSTQTAESKKPFRCLVIQMARLGDTIQSLMALRAAKQLYPQLEIHLLTRERFSHAAKRTQWLNGVFTFPTDDILGPIARGEQSETQGFASIARWISPMLNRNWDMVVNWTFSESSSYLTALIPARIKLGYTRRKDMSLFAVDGWSHYVQAIVQGKISQNVHLTDILTTQLLTALQIHVGDPLPQGDSLVTSKAFFTLSLGNESIKTLFEDSGRKWIGIQLGAGNPAKIWDTERWAKLALLMLQRHPEWSLLLLGGKEDQEREKEFLERVSPHLRNPNSVVSLVGRADFDLWAHAVTRCQWLLAGDTAAIHLASVLGTRIVNISVGPVRHFETGPYGNGHYVITAGAKCAACLDEKSESVQHTCNQIISPEAAYAVWSYAANEWVHRRQIDLETHFAQLGWGEHTQGLRVYRSRIRNTEDGGGATFDAMLDGRLELSDWTGMVMGQIARSWYCGWVPPIGQEIEREKINPTLLQRLRELEESAQVLAKICEQANQTAELLHLKTAGLKSDKVMGVRERQEISSLGTKLTELENLIDRVSKAQPALLGFAQMAKVLMHNLRGEQLTDLGKETARSYKQIGEGISLLKDWIHFTLKLVKPVAIKPATVTPLPEKDLSP